MRKIRKDARCHGTCGLLRSECWCGWNPPSNIRTEANAFANGRPRHERIFTGYEVWDTDAPAWFHEAMMLQVKMLTVSEFARRFGTNPIQVKRWIKLEMIHCAWTWPVYAEDKKWVDDGVMRVPKKKTHVTLMRYTCKRVKGTSHRRIPESELERCQFLHLRSQRRRISTTLANARGDGR